ncbi:MAG: D-alanine--D-alanine ligase, partial [Clostridia bacterium]|nr:D-alanine--D-alanine ligase [Clostridia bacterium]
MAVYVTKNGEWYTGEKLNDLAFYKDENLSSLKKAVLIAGDNKLYTLKKNKLTNPNIIDCAVNCMHGLNGEDGTVAGNFRLSYIPFASPDVLSS